MRTSDSGLITCLKVDVSMAGSTPVSVVAVQVGLNSIFDDRFLK